MRKAHLRYGHPDAAHLHRRETVRHGAQRAQSRKSFPACGDAAGAIVRQSRMLYPCTLQSRTLQNRCDMGSVPLAASQQAPRLRWGREPLCAKRRSQARSSHLAKGPPVEAGALRAIAPRADARRSRHQHVGELAAPTNVSSCGRRGETPARPARELCKGGAAASPGHCRRARRCKRVAWPSATLQTAGRGANTPFCLLHERLAEQLLQ